MDVVLGSNEGPTTHLVKSTIPEQLSPDTLHPGRKTANNPAGVCESSDLTNAASNGAEIINPQQPYNHRARTSAILVPPRNLFAFHHHVPPPHPLHENPIPNHNPHEPPHTNQHPTTSFSEDQPPIPSTPPPPDLLATQEALSEALEELYWLNQGPVGGVINKVLASSVSLQFVLKYDVQNVVPLGRGMGFGELAGRIGVQEKRVKRLLRLAMTDHLFCELKPGWVRHTSLTRALREVEGLSGWCEMYVEEMAPAVGKTVDAVAKWPESEEPNECGFNIANATGKPIFTFFSEDAPSRATRFKTAMAFHEHFPGLERSYVLTGFDWASLPQNATVVDIGGSHGGVSIELAKAFPGLSFVVQDLPDVIDEAGKNDVEGQVKFMAHDFFTEQPVKDADVYFMRFILHNWSDKYCVQILKALVPALKSGARVLLNEQSLQPSSAVPPRYERWQRAADINMMAVFNSQERDESEWVELFRKASPRFELDEVRRTEGALLDMIVFRWK